MILGNKKYKNFFLGRLSSNIGDSFVFQMIPLLLLTFDNSDFLISINGFLLYLPYLVIPLVAYKLDQLMDKRGFLVISELINLILTLVLIACLLFNRSIIFVLVIAGVYYFSIALLYNVQNAFFKNYVEEEDVVEFFRAYELTGTVIDVVLDAIATFVIQSIGFVWSLVLNIFTFLISLLSFSGMKVNAVEVEEERTVFKVSIRELRRNKQFYSVIISDSLVNGFVTMSMLVLPLFLESEGKLIYYPVLLLTKGMASVFGLYMSKHLTKWNYNVLYAMSYTLYFIGIVSFVSGKNIMWMSLFYFVAFAMNAALTPYYSKMMLETYEEQELSQITSYIQFLLVISILIVTFISMFVNLDAYIYMYISGVISLCVGVYQMWVYKTEKET